eukprot:15311442-Alexandrium_andersonii.AAC.1
MCIRDRHPSGGVGANFRPFLGPRSSSVERPTRLGIFRESWVDATTALNISLPRTGTGPQIRVEEAAAPAGPQ